MEFCKKENTRKLKWLFGNSFEGATVTVTKTIDNVTTPKDLTDYEIIGQYRRNDKNGELVKEILIGSGITVLDFENGIFEIDTFVIDFENGNYFFDILLKKDLDRKTICETFITVEKVTTKI